MSLLDQIKKASLEARKNREADKAATLTTLFSEAAMIGKNDGNRSTTDLEVIAAIKKTIKNIDETLSHVSGDSVIKFKAERDLLASFLPKQLSPAEVKEQMLKIKTELNLIGPKSMGLLMKTLKERFDGQYDGGTAAKLSKEILSE